MEKKENCCVSVVIIAAIMCTSLTLFFGTGCAPVKKEVKTKIVEVTRKDLGNNIQATGIIKPMTGSDVIVGARTSGLIKKLYVKIGDRVEKGQVLAKLEDADLKAKLEQAVAQYEKEKADYIYSKIDLERQKELLSPGLVSQSKIDQLQKDFDTNFALMKQAEANINYAQVQLSYTDVNASISGVITDILKFEGEIILISGSTSGLIRIVDLENLVVNTYVDEVDISKIKIGNDVAFTVDAYPNIDFRGRIREIQPNAIIIDNVVNYIAIVVIEREKNAVLRPEMTANVTITLETRKGALVAPTRAITRRSGMKYVTIIKNGEQSEQQVKTGWEDDGYTEIVSGANEGDRIVIIE